MSTGSTGPTGPIGSTGPARRGPRGWRLPPFERDARVVLVTTLTAGAALSLWWIDFNLYLAALGLEPSAIGVVSTIASVVGALAAFPASALSDRIGRRLVLAGGLAAGLVALGLLLASEALGVVILAAALWTAGQQAFIVVLPPFLTEHSRPEHRNELYAAQFAIQNVTNVIAAILGAAVAALVAGSLGLDPDGPATYRVLLVVMAGLILAGLATIALLTDDRPGSALARRRARALGEPASFPADPHRRRAARFGLTVHDRRRFVRFLLPSLLIATGAGQVIPFLNLFIQHRFGLDLTAVNGAFALTSLGTMAAILFQPRIARRYGRIASVVLVQGLSIPFLAVLGFSPVLWTVILAMTVRNALMNAGNPMFTAFAMDHVDAAERATLSAAMSVLWQVGWVVGGAWYAILQATLGFDAGYAVNFATIIVLYSVATALLWAWFGGVERPERAVPGGRVPAPVDFEP